MPIADYFAETFSEARDKFLDAANSAKAARDCYPLHGFKGPRDEELVTDVAWLGAENPESLLVVISGTHGVEGLCGSGCQTGYLNDRLYEALSSKSAVILVHALNPFGFAWLRRVNEDNIDVNRNFHDFRKPLPSSEAYEQLHGWLVPGDWTGPQREKADAALLAYIDQKKDFRIVQAEITKGQYKHRDGLFYSGTKETWSNTTLRQILAKHIVQSVRRIAVLDIHTGLGPTGYGEPIYAGPTQQGLALAKKWYGPEVKSTLQEDSSVSSQVTGAIANALPLLTSDFEVNYLALEFGTIGPWEVLTALRGDNWLHAQASQSCDDKLRDQIKRSIREAFFFDAAWWKGAVYGRTLEFALRATRALQGS